jgi:hypothetical protein
VLADAGVPGAAPREWYGVADPTSTGPLRDLSREDVRVSPSRLHALEECELNWVIGDLGGDPGGATEAAAALAPDDRERILAIVESVTDGDAAIDRLTALLDTDPLDYVTAGWLARIQADAGDPAAAARYARWTQIVQGDSAPGIQALPRTIGGDRDRPQIRLPGYYPAAVYDRPSSGLVFGPGSVTLVP